MTKKTIIKISFLILLIIPFTYHLAYLNKIFPGVKIINLPVGNYTPSEANVLIKDQLPQSPILELIYEQQKWSLDLNSLGFSPNISATVNQAYSFGRNKNIFRNLITQAKLWSKNQNFDINFSLDHDLLNQEIASLSAQINIPTQEPAIKIETQNNQNDILVDPGKNGQSLNQVLLKTQILERLTKINFSPLTLPVDIITPKISPEQADLAKFRAENLLTKKLLVKFEDSHWELSGKDLIAFMDLETGFNRQRITDWLNDAAKTINRPPQNAAFRFENNRVQEFKPAKDGLAVQIENSTDNLISALADIENNPDSGEVNLIVTKVPPIITNDQVNNLGIKEKIAEGKSNFKGSIPSRIHNIELATSKINGILISPGEIFSFNQTVGDISRETGYEQAYIIQNGRTILGDGGGVCQVSTTLFRATLNAGLEIIERLPHAYRVSYYEQGFPPGLDATVFNPTADLKFKNNTSATVLIQTTVDVKNRSLLFELYGTKDNRQITISTPRVWDQTPAPPDLYQDDPTLPVGQTKQIDWKAAGAKVSFNYKVELDGNILQQKTFLSNYKPWQAIFLKGTKTE